MISLIYLISTLDRFINKSGKPLNCCKFFLLIFELPIIETFRKCFHIRSFRTHCHKLCWYFTIVFFVKSKLLQILASMVVTSFLRIFRQRLTLWHWYHRRLEVFIWGLRFCKSHCCILQDYAIIFSSKRLFFCMSFLHDFLLLQNLGFWRIN